MMRLLGVALLVLTLAGVAAAAPPNSVTVLRGTHTGGDVDSLTARDGDTFDIEADQTDKHRVVFVADFGELSGPFAFTWFASASASGARCSFYFSTRGRGRVFIGPSGNGATWHFVFRSPTRFTVKLRCHDTLPYTLRVDQFSMDPET